VSSALEGGKGLQLDDLAKLGEISRGGDDISQLGANLLGLQTLEESVSR